MHLLRAVVRAGQLAGEGNNLQRMKREKDVLVVHFGDTPVQLHAWFDLSIDVQFMRTYLSLYILICICLSLTKPMRGMRERSWY